MVQLLLVLLSLFGLGSAAQWPTPRRDAEYPPPKTLAFLKPLGEICAKETGVSAGTIKRFSDVDIIEDDRALKCYMDCMFRITNVTDDRGELHMGKLLDYVPPEFEDVALRMGVKCTKPKGKDVCERAFWFHKCWKKSDPVYYYLV
ncbi:pheromone-binding protein-related protein 6-like [Anopheles maculipalpis]|uniref:pheromone-binding protein-related protein 6-like n=1 Tax=Anopheles maculipalpis TaxID=1496333 RepID=UPI002158A71C|nr:pheromone-binding protein-related protein 6-like [Anopheles maculipalpis]